MKIKKVVVLASFLILGGLLTFSACSNDNTEATVESTESTEGTEIASVEFYCPMECEGDKTYSEKGECPVCGMALIEKE